MIVMADVGTIPERARAQLIEWVKNGGTLVRFAGSRLITAGNDEELLPVRLRTGERSLGGALVVDDAAAGRRISGKAGPFADLAPPSEVTVSRQVLAEPTPDIVDRTWASLADGTPLVTGGTARQGQCGAVPRHPGRDLVEPAHFGHLRRHAAADRADVAQPGQQRCRP